LRQHPARKPYALIIKCNLEAKTDRWIMDGQTKDDMNVRRRQYIQLQWRDYNDEK